MKIFIFTTIIALLMSCVGLFGLAAQRVHTKMKEICIRKIFGVPVSKAICWSMEIFCAAGVCRPDRDTAKLFQLNALLDSIYTFGWRLVPHRSSSLIC